MTGWPKTCDRDRLCLVGVRFREARFFSDDGAAAELPDELEDEEELINGSSGRERALMTAE